MDDNQKVLTKYCYKCGKTVSFNNNGYPVCEDDGVLWSLRRNSVCAEAFVVRDDGKLLLIKRATNPMIGYWALPGGFSEYGEHPIKTAEREVLEETGWKVQMTGEVLGVYLDSFPEDLNSEHRVVISYLARPISKGTGLDKETHGSDWFDPSDLPKETIPVDLNRFRDYLSKT